MKVGIQVLPMCIRSKDPEKYRIPNSKVVDQVGVFGDPCEPWNAFSSSLLWYVPSLRYTRGLGWRMHCGVEVTESSTNKQHHISQ
jgi:hypothetical protein